MVYQGIIDRIHTEVRPYETQGKIADYIPAFELIHF